MRNGKHPVKSVCIIDLHGLEWGRTRRSIASFNKSCAMLDAYFPERLFVALVVRAPWIFSAIYKLISPALDAGTRDKVGTLGVRTTLRMPLHLLHLLVVLHLVVHLVCLLGLGAQVQILGASADHLGEISKYIDLDQVWIDRCIDG